MTHNTVIYRKVTKDRDTDHISTDIPALTASVPPQSIADCKFPAFLPS